MYLVVDRGNTLLKIALFGEDEILRLWTFSEYSATAFKQLLANINDTWGKLPERGIISDVSGKNNDWFSTYAGVPLITFDHSLLLPVTIRYKTPESLGKDRIALAVGAASNFPGENILIISAGTTITYDFVNRNNEYLGGSISPGIRMRFKALNTFTGKLPLIEPENIACLIGDSTITSILSGVINGVRYEVEGMIEAYRNRFPQIQIVLTGGDMNYFDKYLKSNIFAVSNLVLTGLKDILKYNVEQHR